MTEISRLMGNEAINSETLTTKARIISEMSLTNTIDDSAIAIIKSNEKLDESNKKNSSAMVRLMWALVFVGMAGIAVQIIQIISSNTHDREVHDRNFYQTQLGATFR